MLRSRNSGIRAKVVEAIELQRRLGGMTLSEYYDRQIPDYYDTMYLDGYTPQQISYAVHRKMIREYEARKAAQRAAAEANEIPNVKIISEVKIKR